MLKAEFCSYLLKFKLPSGTSRGVLNDKPTWFIKLWNSENPFVFGIGECSPIKGLSRDPIDKIEQIIQVSPDDFFNFVLYNGDIIDIARDDGVMVNGFVQKPGAYNYFPGYLAYNYISMAGGNTKDGSINKLKIVRKDGTVSRNSELKLKRGDVIIVERSSFHTLAGSMSILQIVTSILTIYMTYLSAVK